MTLSRSLLTPALLLATSLAGCDNGGNGLEEDRGGAQILVGDEKADGAAGVELAGFLGTAAPLDSALTTATPRLAYLFYASAGTKVDLEVTRGGTAAGLDTVMTAYGPRTVEGTYPTTVASDDDSGYGKLSRIKGMSAPAAGFYLVEVTSKAAPVDSRKFRLALKCVDGTCDRPGPAAPIGMDLRWSQRSAEFKAASLQAYRLASARLDALAPSGSWAVVMDIDETTLSNLTYQRERAELGSGYSSASWLAWVGRKAAAPLPGAAGFIDKVQAKGGKVVFVTNRKAVGECDPTRENLAAVGIRYQAILCRTDSSDKNPRFDAIEAGTAAPGLAAATVVLYVGDNIQDFPGLTQDIRNQDDAAFAAFGDSHILIPNPMYGSWEKNP